MKVMMDFLFAFARVCISNKALQCDVKKEELR